MAGLCIVLRNAWCCPCFNGLHGFEHGACSQLHHAVVYITRGFIFADGHFVLKNNAARINFVLEKKSGHARFCIAVDHGPIDGRCPPITWQQGTV